MENTVENAAGSHVEEQVNGEASVLEERREERVDLILNEMKAKEGEEIFEEAVDSHDCSQEEEWELNSGANADGLGDAVNAESSSNLLDANSSVRNEVENFEEAIGTPSKVQKPGDVLEEIEGLAGAESVGGGEVVDGVDEGGTLEEVPSKEDDASVGNTEAIVTEIAQLHEDKELHNDADELVLKFGSSLQNLENEISTERTDDVREENGSAFTEGQLHVGEDGETDKDSNKRGKDKIEDNGNAIVEGQLDIAEEGEPKLDSLDSNDQNEGLVENCLAIENQVICSGDPEVTPPGNQPEDMGDGTVMLETQMEGSVNREFRSATEGLDSVREGVKGEIKDSSPSVVIEYLKESNGDMEDVVNGLDSTQEKISGQLLASADMPSAHVQDRSVSNESGGFATAEEFKTEKDEKVPAGMTDDDTRDVSPHPQQPVDNVNEPQANRTLLRTPENKDSVNREDSGRISREVETRATEGVASSARPTASTTARPAGLGRAAPLLEPAARAAQQPRVNGAVSHMQAQPIEDPANGDSEDHDETREKLQMIRVKFLRLAHRLGQTPHNVVVAQVLYRLGLAEQLRGRNGGRVGAFSFDRASAMAEQLEASGQEPLDFSCTIMVLGKTGVGKSATINSIFDEVKFSTDAFDMGTKKVQDVVGTVQGIKVRIIDTPGLLPSLTDQRHNEKILQSIKRFIKKTPPDIVLYLDRLDMQSRDLSDMPLLRTITEIFGPSIWFNAIVVLTHAASAPPEGPNGTASSYDMFVTQRSHVVQQSIRQAAGDMRLMNPVSLVENHSACRTNRAGQRVLPNGQVWKPHLLLLSFASKILAEANALLKLQDSPPGKPFASRSRAPPLPFLLSTLLQPRAQPKLPEEQYGDDDGVDDDLDESSDSDDESEYDELPPFKPLTKAQVAKLTRAQKKAYFDEVEYREKLFMKKQLKEERRRRRMLKKMAAAAKDQQSEYVENAEEESGGAASVAVPMPDLALPSSFDADNPTHRYRYLDNSTQWLVRPVLDTHGWDHDVGYEGINVERMFVLKERIPLSFSGQVTKDKKDANIQMEVASSVKHGEGKATSLGFDMQTVGKDLAYTLRSETRFSNFRKNKATAGLSFTLLNDALSAGLKVEDKLILNKWLRLVMTGGAITARGDVAYGGSLDATLRDKDYPLGRSLFTLGLSVMDWHGDLAVGGNIQSQLPIGRFTNLIARANLNNRGAGQVSLRVNSSEQLQIALIGLVPLLKKVLDYPQQWQFGQ